MRGRFTAEGCHSLPKTHQCFALYIPTHCALTTWLTAVLWVFTDEGSELEFRKLKSVNTYKGVGRPVYID